VGGRARCSERLLWEQQLNSSSASRLTRDSQVAAVREDNLLNDRQSRHPSCASAPGQHDRTGRKCAAGLRWRFLSRYRLPQCKFLRSVAAHSTKQSRRPNNAPTRSIQGFQARAAVTHGRCRPPDRRSRLPKASLLFPGPPPRSNREGPSAACRDLPAHASDDRPGFPTAPENGNDSMSSESRTDSSRQDVNASTYSSSVRARASATASF
jgi:hypothetical protein